MWLFKWRKPEMTEEKKAQVRAAALATNQAALVDIGERVIAQAERKEQEAAVAEQAAKVVEEVKVAEPAIAIPQEQVKQEPPRTKLTDLNLRAGSTDYIHGLDVAALTKVEEILNDNTSSARVMEELSYETLAQMLQRGDVTKDTVDHMRRVIDNRRRDLAEAARRSTLKQEKETRAAKERDFYTRAEFEELRKQARGLDDKLRHIYETDNRLVYYIPVVLSGKLKPADCVKSSHVATEMIFAYDLTDGVGECLFDISNINVQIDENAKDIPSILRDAINDKLADLDDEEIRDLLDANTNLQARMQAVDDEISAVDHAFRDFNETYDINEFDAAVFADPDYKL